LHPLKNIIGINKVKTPKALRFFFMFFIGSVFYIY